MEMVSSVVMNERLKMMDLHLWVTVECKIMRPIQPKSGLGKMNE